MYNKAMEVLKIFNDNGYEAYIVGGYPRDYLLGIKTNDIDICTNATPKEIMEIFDTDGVGDITYGAVKVIYKGYLYDVTTFRKEIKYEDNRRPVKIKYVKELKKDILRRDFTINTICIDMDGNYIDILNGKEDIDKKIIKTVGNPRYRLKEDSLRILRAIRFAANIDFEIDNKTKYYIKKYGYLLKNLSGYRKREELDKILTSKNREKGRRLLIELGIDKALGITNLDKIVLCDDIIGVWSQIECLSEIPFSKSELEIISKVKLMMGEDVNKYTIYKYGLYVSTIVGSIKGVSYKKINNIYKSLPIISRKDIVIKGNDIMECLNKGNGSYLKEILNEIEMLILDEKIKNDKEEILKYIKDKY